MSPSLFASCIPLAPILLLPLFHCPPLPEVKIFLKSLEQHWKDSFLPWEERGRSRSSSLAAPFAIGSRGRLAQSRTTNVLLGDFISAPFFPRLTPWMVAVAVILMVLGLLTIGSIFGTWRLYRERARQRKDEFSSKGESQAARQECFRVGWTQVLSEDIWV